MTRKLDLLVVAPSAKDLYQELATDFSAKEPNIWAGLLANSARNSGNSQQPAPGVPAEAQGSELP